MIVTRELQENISADYTLLLFFSQNSPFLVVYTPSVA